MTAITQTLSSALLQFIWQGTLVGCMLWVTLFLLRNRSANARYLASCLALVILAAIPVVTTSEALTLEVSLVESVAARASKGWVAGSTVTASSTSWFVWAQRWALTAWSIGVLLFSLRIVWSCRYIYALKRRGELAEQAVVAMVENLARRMGILRPVRVLTSSVADGPSVVGWLRPIVLLPASSILGLNPEQLETVIAHEIAHIRRHDYLVGAFQVVVETLLFYHPAVWWTSSRIPHEREFCCDDLAVRACGDAMCYARALTTLEKLRVAKPSLVLGARDGGLLYRIQRVIGDPTMTTDHPSYQAFSYSCLLL